MSNKKMSTMRVLRITSLLLLLVGLMVFLWKCQPKDPDPAGRTDIKVGCDGDPAGTNCRYFSIPKDSTFNYSSGTEIIAKEGMEINGDMIIQPDQEGDFVLTALDGDIILAGTIAFDTTENSNNGGRVAANNNGKNGRSIIINAENGSIIIKNTQAVFAEDGVPGSDEILGSTLFANVDSGYVAAGNGGDGGDIILNAPNGKISLPPISEIANKHILFHPGNGGKGGSAILNGSDFVVNEEVLTLYLKGGNGGASGEVLLIANEIQGMWSASDLENTEPFFIQGGVGGRGGNAHWFLYLEDPELTNLENIYFEGGKGGKGIIVGGKGGYAACFLNRVINKIGGKVTDVHVTGGDGGDVIGSNLAMKNVYAGDGGEFLAIGANGWSGGKEPGSDIISKHGARGGSVFATGGRGGWVQSSVTAYKASAGDGAMTYLSRDTFVDELTQFLGLPSADFQAPFFGVIAGNGGDGLSACLTENGGEGGDGGSVGNYSIEAGYGGSTEANAMVNIHGDGGDIWTYGGRENGNGGDGRPPGTGGTGKAKGNAEPGVGYEPGKIAGTKLEAKIGEDGKTCEESCNPGGLQTGYYEVKQIVRGGGNEIALFSKYTSLWRITSETPKLIYQRQEIDRTVYENGINKVVTDVWEWHLGDEVGPWNLPQFRYPFRPACAESGIPYIPGGGIQTIHEDETKKIIMGTTGCFKEWDEVECTCGGNNGGTIDCH